MTSYIQKSKAFRKRFGYYLLVGIISVCFLGNSVASAANFDEQFYSSNDILFYDPRGSSCSTGSGTLGTAPTQLKGESNAEKVWNYLIGRGLTPIAAAGAMGNLEQESAGFNPWAGEGGNTTLNKSAMGVGFGIIQWTNTDGNTQGRRYKVMKYLEDNGVKLDASDASQMDNALLYQLNWLWDGEYGKTTWQEGINAESSVEGDTSKNPVSAEENTGNGSTLYFHASVERSADSPSMLQERIDSAKNFLEKFGNGAQGCSIGEGGLTIDQAKKLMTYYADIETDDAVRSLPGMAGFYTLDGCPGKPNCTAFSAYFIAKFTNMKSNAMGYGYEKVRSLAADNPGSQTGTMPQPFAVFSTGTTSPGHTGIILGIHGDTAVIGEASCGAGRQGIRAFETPVSKINSGEYTYLYTTGSVKQDVLSGVING